MPGACVHHASILYFAVTCNPTRAVTLPAIGVPLYIGVPHRVFYPYTWAAAISSTEVGRRPVRISRAFRGFLQFRTVRARKVRYLACDVSHPPTQETAFLRASNPLGGVGSVLPGNGHLFEAK